MVPFLVTFRTGCQTTRVSAGLWALGMAGTLLQVDPRLHFPAFLVAIATATVGWLGWVVSPGARAQEPGLQVGLPRWAPWVAVAAGGLVRAVAIAQPPGFSGDLFRHVYEGQVVWSQGWTFPYRVAPAEAPAAGVPEGLLGADWQRVNHPELATLYPPVTQGAMALAGGLSLATGLPGTAAVKLVLVGAETAGVVILARWVSPRLALGWWLCPWAVWEIAREGHADGLAAVGYAVALAAARGHRWTGAFAGFGVAIGAKLHGIVGFWALAWARRSGVAAGVGAAVLALAVGASRLGGTDDGLTAYATRWEANAGLYAGLEALARGFLGGEWTRWAGFTVTVDGVARALAGLLFAGVVAWDLRWATPGSVVFRVGHWLLGLLLLSPTVHPWYTLWLLPFWLLPEDPAGGRSWRPSAGTLAALTAAPLLHLPSAIEATSGRWSEWPALAWGVHGLLAVGWGIDALRHAPRTLRHAPRAID